jgi:transcriptional regulator with XRE-family HTH domain
MSLAIEHLRDYLAREKVTQAEFAHACGYDASLVSNVLSGAIGISARNIERLLHGVQPTEDKLRFVAAYLRDQIPAEFVHQVSVAIEPNSEVGTDGSNDADLASVAILHLAEELPMHTKTQLFHFVKALRRDAQLRSVFEGLMRYVPDDSHPANPPLRTEQLPEGRKKETAGPFPVAIMKKALAKRDAAKASKQGKSKSSLERDTPARSAPERTTVEKHSGKS